MKSKLFSLHYRLVHQGASNPLEYLLFYCLIPFSCLYGCISWGRNLLYDLNIKSSYCSALPVVSVGNISAGGTGKTPFVDYLVKFFHQQGKRPAVVSRGYGGSFKGSVGVVADHRGVFLTAAEAGDEPVLLARRNPGCTVMITTKRAEAVKQIEKGDLADVVILDDGFQHRSLKRDVDIVLLDAQSPWGNGWPLPAGNLREFRSGLNRADILMRTKVTEGIEPLITGRQVFDSHYCLAETVVGLDGRSIPIEDLKDKKVAAFSGIANPDCFFADLEKAGLVLNGTVSFVDHVDYTDLVILQQLPSRSENFEVLVTTEKDAVKLTADMFELPCYYVPMHIDISASAELLSTLTQRLWRESMDFPSQLLDILACPKCKGPVEADDDVVLCYQCQLSYPMRDNIPVMLIDEAETF